MRAASGVPGVRSRIAARQWLHAGTGSGYGTLAWAVGAAPAPEPSALALMSLGVVGLMLRRRSPAR